MVAENKNTQAKYFCIVLQYSTWVNHFQTVNWGEITIYKWQFLNDSKWQKKKKKSSTSDTNVSGSSVVSTVNFGVQPVFTVNMNFDRKALRGAPVNWLCLFKSAFEQLRFWPCATWCGTQVIYYFMSKEKSFTLSHPWHLSPPPPWLLKAPTVSFLV